MKLNELPLGARVLDGTGKTAFITAGQDHYVPGGITLAADHVIAMACFDAKEPGSSPDQAKYGCNTYRDSNIHVWLNSAGYGWFKKQRPGDEAPDNAHVYDSSFAYDNEPGFLSRFSPEFVTALMTAQIETLVPENGWHTERIPAKVWLLSLTELGFAGKDDIPEGRLIPLFRDYRYRICAPAPELDGAEYENGVHQGECWWYWTRTPVTSTDCLTWRTQNGMTHCGEYPCYGHTGIRPALVLPGDAPVKRSNAGYILGI